MRLLTTIFSGTFLAFLLLSTSGCATQETATEKDFGNSVAAMIQGQTLDPTTAMLPDPNAIDEGDGERLGNVLEAYRTDNAHREVVQEKLIIDAGN